jgi:hypothetical protein
MRERPTGDTGQKDLALNPPQPLPPELVRPDKFVVNLSPDRHAATVVFNGTVAAGLDPNVGADTVATVATFFFPVCFSASAPATFRGGAAVLRGFLQKGPAARVAVLLELGGACRTLEFPYGETNNGNFREAVFSFEGFSADAGGGQGGTTQAQQLPPAPHYTAILIVSVQRRTKDASAMIQLDSLDVEIVDPQPPPSQST